MVNFDDITTSLGREEDQEDILATALYLSQSQPQLTGMSAEAWVRDAIVMRAKVKAIGDVFWADEEKEASCPD